MNPGFDAEVAKKFLNGIYWLGYSAEIATLNCNSTNLKKIREMKVVICTRDSTKVLKASLSLKQFQTELAEITLDPLVSTKSRYAPIITFLAF